MKLKETHVYLILGVLIAFILTWKMMINENLTSIYFYRDFIWSRDYYKTIFYTWNEYTSSPNFDMNRRIISNVLFGLLHSYALFYFLISMLGFIFMAITLSYCYRKWLGVSDLKTLTLMSSLGSFIWVFSRVYANYLGLFAGAIFIPLFLLIPLVYLFSNSEFRLVVLYGVVLALSFSFDFRYVVYQSLPILLFTVFAFIFRRELSCAKVKLTKLAKLAASFLVFLLISMPILSLANVGHVQYTLSKENYDLLSSKCSFLNFITFEEHWWQYTPLKPFNGVSVNCLRMLEIITAILSFLGLIILRNRGMLFILSSMLLFLFLIGIRLNYFLFSYLPQNIAWMFRTPYRWEFYLLFFYALSLPAVIYVATERIRRKKIRITLFLSLSIIIIVSLINHSFYSGCLEYLQPIDESSLNLFAYKNEEDGKFIIFPEPEGRHIKLDNETLHWRPGFEYLVIKGLPYTNHKLLIDEINLLILSDQETPLKKITSLLNIHGYLFNQKFDRYDKYEQLICNVLRNKNATTLPMHLFIELSTPQQTPFKLLEGAILLTSKPLSWLTNYDHVIPIDVNNIGNSELALLLHGNNNIMVDREDIERLITLEIGGNNAIRIQLYTPSADPHKGWAFGTFTLAGSDSYRRLILEEAIKNRNLTFYEANKPINNDIIYTLVPSKPLNEVKYTLMESEKSFSFKDNASLEKRWLFNNLMAINITETGWYKISACLTAENAILPHLKILEGNKSHIPFGFVPNELKPFNLTNVYKEGIFYVENPTLIQLQFWRHGYNVDSFYILKEIKIQKLDESPNTFSSQVHIPKDGSYELIIRGKGNFKLKLNETSDIEINHTSNILQWFRCTVWLKKGANLIKIESSSGSGYIDEILLVPTHIYYNSQNSILKKVIIINDLSEISQLSTIIIKDINTYSRINPTLWKVYINATEPFMLSFAEPYDPLWVCYINGKKIRSIPLYGIINGFWIDQTGLLEISIEYEPQKWFYMGSIISVSTLIACITYLIYDWIKKKDIIKRIKKRVEIKTTIYRLRNN